MHQTKLSEIMTRQLVTVQAEDDFEVVDRIFKAHEFHHLPVVDKAGKLIGILSKSDYLMMCDAFTYFKTKDSAIKNKKLFASMLVQDIMHKNVAKLKPENTVLAAAGFFKENRFHAIPIVDEDNKLAGMVTTLDLINLAFSQPANQ